MVIASMSQIIALPLSVVEVELVAAVRALEFSLEIRISSIVIEGDLELVIILSKMNPLHLPPLIF